LTSLLLVAEGNEEQFTSRVYHRKRAFLSHGRCTYLFCFPVPVSNEPTSLAVAGGVKDRRGKVHHSRGGRRPHACMRALLDATPSWPSYEGRRWPLRSCVLGEAAGAGLAQCGRRGPKAATHAMRRRRMPVLRAEDA